MGKLSWTWILLLAAALVLGAALALPLALAQEGDDPPGEDVTPTPDDSPPPVETPPPSAVREFPRTDFSRHSVSYSEIMSGGPPKDGIPAIDNPKFVAVDEADEWLEPTESVVLFRLGEDTRAYPIQILMWHEIVNDVVDSAPVVVTYCPLCNTGIAFDAMVEGQALDFGTTGRLRISNLIMYDRQTESWWQQATGEAIVGAFTGARLNFLPVSIVAWEDFKAAFPEGLVLSRETGYYRDYGRNPYVGYDDAGNWPFLYRGSVPGALPPMARVLTIDTEDEAAAYPYEVMETVRVVNDTVGGMPVVVMWSPGAASPLDASAVSAGREVGAALAYSRVLDGDELTFHFDGEEIVDDQTGSVWDGLGRAVSGKLEGSQLNEVPAINHFWFSWAAFKPETRIYEGDS